MLTELASSGGKVVLIRGEAGVGKSALAHEFVRSHRGKARVHMGTCDDLFIPQPLGPFWDMARAEPSLRLPLESGDRPHLLQAVLDLLSRPTPTLMVIEDTHWPMKARWTRSGTSGDESPRRMGSWSSPTGTERSTMTIRFAA
ncbi:hypothetical protein BH23CHL8_BH23CHL8_32190 [soil metagenome]